MNTIKIDGTLVKDPLYKVTDKGDQFYYNSILNVEGKKNSYFTIVAFGETASSIAELKKNDFVTVEGILEVNSYEKDGKKIYSNRIRVTEFKSDNFPF